MTTQVEKTLSGSAAGVGGAEENSLQALREASTISADDGMALRQADAESAFMEQPCVDRVETLLVESHGLFREGLRRILADTTYRLSASTATLDEIHPMLEAGSDVRLLIVDGDHDHEATCGQIRSLKEQNPSLRIVMLVERCDRGPMLAAIEAGASAYIAKSTSPEALVKMLDLVMLGEVIVPGAVLSHLLAPAAVPSPIDVNGLTEREAAILKCLTEGAQNKVIARRLDITEATVKVHVKAILRKLRAKNRTQAALWASTHLATRNS